MKKKNQVLSLSCLIYLFSNTAFALAATGTPKNSNVEKANTQIDLKNSTLNWPQRQSMDEAILNSQPSAIATKNQAPENQVISVEQLSNFNPETENSTNKENEYSDPLGQVTSVDQLSDVQPTDWAFQALQSLVERYGCIVGYPDGSFRGNRAITRYEFAAGLNACLERIQQLIAFETADLITQEDLAVLERLQANFAVELAEIEGRVDALEARTKTLEGQQFSTTTKFSGQIVMHIADAFGEEASEENETVLQYRSRMRLRTSFTGTDILNVGINAGNPVRLNSATQFPRGSLSSRTSETILMFGNSRDRVDIGNLSYAFQVNEKLRWVVSAFSDDRILSQLITPISGLDIGPISNYGRLNTMLFPIFLQAGTGFRWSPVPWYDLDFFVGSESGSPEDPRLGLFSGGYGISARSVFRLDPFNMVLYYNHSYSPENGIGTASGSNASAVTGAGPVAGNTYLAAAFYQFSPKFILGASGAFSNARTLGDGTRGDANVINYRVNMIFPDLFQEGNIAGLIAGIQPRLTYTSNRNLARAIGLPPGQRSDRDTGWHLEAFYTFRISDNITITPGVFWLTAPNHDERNDDVVIGALRTTFNF